MKKTISIITLTALIVGCSTTNLTEEQRLIKSIRKELPFSIDSLYNIRESTYDFHSKAYISTQPDYSIDADGKLIVYRSTILESTKEQEKGQIWRNVVVSKRNHRVVCIDRVLNPSGIEGRIYVMQMESAKYPTLGGYHWDVSDSRNLQAVGQNLDDFKQQTLRWMRGEEEVVRPKSQDEYWHLMFHADSLFDAKRYDEAVKMYNLAFNVDKYILPSQLSTVAKKMVGVGRRDEAMRFLNRRLELEPDF